MTSKTAPTKAITVVKATISAPKQVWTENDLIDAYNKGKEAMREQFITAYKENISLAQGMSESLVDRLSEECNVKFDSVRLKSDAGRHFTSLVTIPLDSFLDIDSFDKISKVADDFNKYSSSEYSICFLFMPKTESMNLEAMSADGYFIKMINGK